MEGRSEQHFMTPLQRDPWDRYANSKKLISDYCFVNFTNFSVKDVQFLIKLPMWPKGSPKKAKGSPRAGQRDPKAPKGRPEGAQELPEESKGNQKKTPILIFMK